MSQRKLNTAAKYNAIRQKYKALRDVKENGVQKYHTQWIIHQLAKEFFLSPGQIENIVWRQPEVISTEYRDLFSSSSSSST